MIRIAIKIALIPNITTITSSPLKERERMRNKKISTHAHTHSLSSLPSKSILSLSFHSLQHIQMQPLLKFLVQRDLLHHPLVPMNNSTHLLHPFPRSNRILEVFKLSTFGFSVKLKKEMRTRANAIATRDAFGGFSVFFFF